jgi:tetratricopeptide (TPR) repeat protein
MREHSCVRTTTGWLQLAGMAALLSGCGSFGSRQAPLSFPTTVSNQSVYAPGALGSSLDRDPAEMAAINPFDPIALNNLAVMEAGRGRYQQASSLLQRAVRLAPARADIAANLSNLQRWLAQAEGQAALGLTPQPLQLPYQETRLPEVPPLWAAPAQNSLSLRANQQTPAWAQQGRPETMVQPEAATRLTPAPMLAPVAPGGRPLPR